MPDQPETPDSQKDLIESIKKMMAEFNVRPQPQADTASTDEDAKKRTERREKMNFRLKPKDVKRHLDRFVIKQDEAKRVLATAVCDHYNHIRTCFDEQKCKDYSKQNIVLLGPTGVGKTYLIRSLSELIGVPFVKADATKFSETGYVGGDVDDLIRELVHKAEGDIALAECGMIYLDEIDKIASASNLQGRDVSGAGVQRGLLKIMEETEVPLRNPQDVQSQIQSMLEFQQKGKVTRPAINTRHILFIVSGAFSGLDSVIDRRIKESAIGFAAHKHEKVSKEKLLRQVRTEDFIQYGFEPEFIGRMPVRVVCDPLSVQDLYHVLTTSEGSILKQYTASFKAYNIDIEFENDALWEIAQHAYDEKTGARGLATVCERILRDVKYELPSTQLTHFLVRKEYVSQPERALDILLKEERAERGEQIKREIKGFEQIFADKHGVKIEFNAEAVEELVKRIPATDQTTHAYLEKLLSQYPYGLGLIQKQKPKRKFLLPLTVIQDPNHTLESWIKAAYEG